MAMHLDFIRPHRRASAAGWIILGLAAAASVAVLAWTLAVIEPRLQTAEAEQARLQRSWSERQPKAVRLTDEQLASEWSRATKVAAELAVPWNPLFQILDGAADQQVALLSLDPDGVRHELQLTGEARNFAALLDYYRYLQQQPMLNSVSLKTHQVNRQDRDKPVRFRITTRWEATP